MKSANLGLSFTLEILALLAVGYAAYQWAAPAPWKFALAVGAPLALAILWAQFLAPKAARRIPMPGRRLAKVLIFTISAAALYGAGKPGLAGALLGLIVLNALLAVRWRQD